MTLYPVIFGIRIYTYSLKTLQRTSLITNLFKYYNFQFNRNNYGRKKLDSSVDIHRGELMLFIGEDPIAFGSSAALDVSTEELDISNK